MDKKDIFMLIIGILSLIIMYKIYNGGLVEGAIQECLGQPMGTFCEDEALTKKCWPDCPSPDRPITIGGDVVASCVGKYDATSGKQCVYELGKNYRRNGTGFGCRSGDNCTPKW